MIFAVIGELNIGHTTNQVSRFLTVTMHLLSSSIVIHECELSLICACNKNNIVQEVCTGTSLFEELSLNSKGRQFYLTVFFFSNGNYSLHKSQEKGILPITFLHYIILLFPSL